MKKRIGKLALHRETLRHLDREQLAMAAGGAEDNPSYDSGDSWCWCSNPCTVPVTEAEAVR